MADDVTPPAPAGPVEPLPPNEPAPWAAAAPPEPEPFKRRPRSGAEIALPWLLAVLVVLILAASGGLVTAWVVANLRAVPVPVAAGPTPTIRPSPTVAPTPTEIPAESPTVQPLHTPTAAPEITPEPEPFVHVVQRGEYLQYIADLYGVTVEEIVALNDIRNPNRIRIGQELLIPGPSPAP